MNLFALAHHDGGNILVDGVGTFLGARDLAGAMAACRTLRQVLPDAVRALEGFSKRTTTDDVIIGLVQRFPRLRCIDLRNCGNLTDAAITAVADKCPHLASLNVGCYCHLTDAAIETFEERRPGVRIHRGYS